MQNFGKFFVFTSFITTISFWFWTFTQSDPNLYYSWTPAFVRFQNTMWLIGQNKNLVTAWFCFTLLGLGLWYRVVLFQKRIALQWFLFPLFFILISNVALSHDLFNYMFNAKAVLVYQINPHLYSALEIASHDEWLRFMHNVHTQAPYGYVWTVLSFFPSLLGFGKFLPTFLLFKFFMLLGIIVLFFLQKSLAFQLKDERWNANWKWLFFNPLFLIETLSSAHNDVWMMAMAFGSLSLLFASKKAVSLSTLGSFVVLLLSTQIKLATVLLIPVWSAIYLYKFRKIFHIPTQYHRWSGLIVEHWPELSCLVLFIPLVTARSQQFHPWYLIWPLSFIPFMQHQRLKMLLVVFSFTSMLRYLPFLWVGEHSDKLLLQSQLITWSAIPLSLLLWIIYLFIKRLRYNKQR